MPEAAYEILALLMRYVFTALGALICLLAFRWLLREHRLHRREQRQLPRAGQIGVLEFTDSGERLPLNTEGLAGAGAGCDVVIRKRGLRRGVSCGLPEPGGDGRRERLGALRRVPLRPRTCESDGLDGTGRADRRDEPQPVRRVELPCRPRHVARALLRLRERRA